MRRHRINCLVRVAVLIADDAAERVGPVLLLPEALPELTASERSTLCNSRPPSCPDRIGSSRTTARTSLSGSLRSTSCTRTSCPATRALPDSVRPELCGPRRGGPSGDDEFLNGGLSARDVIRFVRGPAGRRDPRAAQSHAVPLLPDRVLCERIPPASGRDGGIATGGCWSRRRPGRSICRRCSNAEALPTAGTVSDLVGIDQLVYNRCGAAAAVQRTQPTM